MAEKSKSKRIQDEYNRLSKLYEEVPQNKRELVDGLIVNASFMRIELDDMSKTISETGATEEYKNGENQFGLKPSSVLSAYNQTLRNYTQIIDKLDKMLPVQTAKKSKLEAFLSDD